MDYYPLFLDLRGKSCLVVGGGPIARRRVQGLLEAGSRVKVVAREASAELVEWARAGGIELEEREYDHKDLAGVFLVVAATDDPVLQAAIAREAKERGLLVNSVDDAANSNFIAPAVVRRGEFAIAVSTGGRSPALAARMRERIEGMFGPEYEEFVDLLGRLRSAVAARFPDPEARKAVWYRLVDSDCLDLIRRGEYETMWERLEEVLFRDGTPSEIETENIEQPTRAFEQESNAVTR
jgi:siroheme synthase-like protein